jgi:hypothetical protein
MREDGAVPPRFEEKSGTSWVSQRKAFAFKGKTIIPTLMGSS